MKGVFKLFVLLSIGIPIILILLFATYLDYKRIKGYVDRDKQRTYALQDIAKCLQQMCVDK